MLLSLSLSWLLNSIYTAAKDDSIDTLKERYWTWPSTQPFQIKHDARRRSTSHGAVNTLLPRANPLNPTDSTGTTTSSSYLQEFIQAARYNPHHLLLNRGGPRLNPQRCGQGSGVAVRLFSFPRPFELPNCKGLMGYASTPRSPPSIQPAQLSAVYFAEPPCRFART